MANARPRVGGGSEAAVQAGEEYTCEESDIVQEFTIVVRILFH